MHGGAKGSGAPKGERNGNYRHGQFTGEAVEELRAIRGLLRRCRSTLTALNRDQARAALALVSPSYYVHHARLAELATQYRLPSMFGWSEFPRAGGLMSYGPNLDVMFRLCAGQIDKLLRGAKPGELPVEQASKYEFAVNLKTVRTLEPDPGKRADPRRRNCRMRRRG